tara:strand:+ start:2970 stop:4106 length:1137 start_codon:yes stop_codon:yes gene_type:complete
MNINSKYSYAISSFLEVDNDQIFTYWKGRVALYCALKAIGVGKGDEVILPAFTCVVVPNAILYLGANPVYVDIEKRSLCSSVSQIESKITANTKCIIIQNMLGLSYEVEEIINLSKLNNIYTIEDCTHGFGGKYNGSFNGTRADFSFYSTQWNKPFSTGIGGILYVKNESLIKSMELINNDLKKPSKKNVIVLKILIFARSYFLKNWSYWFFLKLYRFLSSNGIVVGSSSSSELEKIELPKDYLLSLSNVQAKKGLIELKNFNQKLKQRFKNGLIINEWMRMNDKIFIPNNLLKNHSFLKYPIFVKNREKFLLIAEKNKIPIGDWFISPLHPLKGGFSKWNLEISDYPNSTEISSKILNLSTDSINFDFLEKYKDQIL